jgi:hypothetical protein
MAKPQVYEKSKLDRLEENNNVRLLEADEYSHEGVSEANRSPLKLFTKCGSQKIVRQSP